MIRIAHWSDSHGDLVGTQNAWAAIASLAGVSMTIHTGDVRHNSFADDMSYANLGNCQFVVGNHDMITLAGQNNGYNWTMQPTQRAAYNAYFRPFLANRDIQITQDTLYWYKDFDTFRFIGLDCTARGTVGSQELQWLNALLEDHTKPVWLASHIITSTATLRASQFTAEYFKTNRSWPSDNVNMQTNYYPYMTQLFDVVNAAVGDGLQVIAWLFGHEHADGFFTSNAALNQDTYPCIVLGSTLHDGYNDTRRTDAAGDWANDACVNVYDWYQDARKLVISRVGAPTTHGAATRRIASFDYRTHTYVSAMARNE